ncbi:MAG: DinB family protein [Candidatus Thorarchaeota archaeon]|nr:DinB family protein [Candidatus Thorarchaeota archaeon]
MTQSLRSVAINILATAEINLLNSFIEIRPEDIQKQALPEFNTITWIIGHCFSHFHMVLCRTCQESEIISEETVHYFRYGTTKEEISTTDAPMTFAHLVEEYLKISASGFSYLQSLEDSHFEKVIFPEYNETLLQSIQRIALHFMGHTGQIVLLRRALGKPGPSFVGGVQESGRKKIRQEWEAWWYAKKANFKI